MMTRYRAVNRHSSCIRLARDTAPRHPNQWRSQSGADGSTADGAPDLKAPVVEQEATPADL
jgi:hypothetical protein